jgi:hypothetical protein
VRFFTELCAVYSGKVTLLTDNYKNIIEADCEGQRKSKVNTFLLSTLYKVNGLKRKFKPFKLFSSLFIGKESRAISLCR